MTTEKNPRKNLTENKQTQTGKMGNGKKKSTEISTKISAIT